MQSAFARVYKLEQQYGGLIRGAIAKHKERKKSGAVDRTKASLFSFDDGMETLVKGLAEFLYPKIHLGMEVQSVTPTYPGFEIRYKMQDGSSRLIHAQQVILTSPAYISAKMISEFAPEVSQGLNEIPYAPIAVVFQGYEQTAVQNPLNGFGFLVPEKEKRNILGCIWSSSLFSHRAPKGFVALTTFVGGARNPELVAADDAGIEKMVEEDLSPLLGLQKKPVVTRIKRWQKAIPQYTMGHEERIAKIEQLERKYPGLHILGNFRGGISIGDCVDQAFAFSEKMKTTLSDGKHRSSLSIIEKP